jgi:hypothetical protein
MVSWGLITILTAFIHNAREFYLARVLLGAAMESILETKASTILDFFAGLRGTLSVAFEEGTSAA